MTKDVSRHTLIQSIILHLFPGIIMVMVDFLLVPLIMGYGVPNDLAYNADTVLALVPIQLGILLYVTKQNTGTYKIASQLPYLEKSSLKEYLIFIPLMAIWAIAVNDVLTPLEINFRDTVFTFIPTKYFIGNYDLSSFSNGKIILTSLVCLLLNGFTAPIMEEVYFRGYLLPRINLSQNKAILLNAALFSLYHFFTPWHFFSRLLMTIPLYYWVVKKRNIRFSIVAHIIANSVTSLSMLLYLS
jgi:membrane protease YdiL (CAAX protease family)